MNEPVSERNYIDIQDLGKVRCLTYLLKSIVSENSESITKEEMREVGEIIHTWRERLEHKVNCK